MAPLVGHPVRGGHRIGMTTPSLTGGSHAYSVFNKIDAPCKIQGNIHVFRLVNNMHPGKWAHIVL